MKTVLIIIGVILLILLVLYLVFGPGRKESQEPETGLPPSVQRLIPPSWDVITDQVCDFDGDGQDEWLVVYHYDNVNVHPSGQPAETTVVVSPIGGVIYDAKLEAPAQTGTSQRQITTITPYRLLPDYAISKGQGYLGESAAATLLFPPVDKEGKCQPTEVGFLGYSNGNTNGATSLPTRLSLFHWVNKDAGYQGSHFVGNARIDADIPTEPNKFVTHVTTYNLMNDRSLLCQVTGYERSDAKQSFYVVPGSTTLDFCYGAPADPTYPDGTFKNRSMGPYSYQNGGDWCWFGGRMVQQLAAHGLYAEAYDELRPMVNRVVKHAGFYEWWTPDNQPRGSGQFRGSAGVLGKAILMLRTWAERTVNDQK